MNCLLFLSYIVTWLATLEMVTANLYEGGCGGRAGMVLSGHLLVNIESLMSGAVFRRNVPDCLYNIGMYED